MTTSSSNKPTKIYVLQDQFGQASLVHAPSPRQAVLKETSSKTARKLYQDTKDGLTFHVGYESRGRWFDIYEAVPMRKEVRL